MEIEVYQGGDLRKGAMKALRYRLFQNGWMLGDIYRDLRNGNSYNHDCGRIRTVLIAILDYAHIASAVITSKDSEFQVFVRKRHRRKGIGSALYAKAMEINKRTKPLKMWVDHSSIAKAFYDSNVSRDWVVIEEDNNEYETFEIKRKETQPSHRTGICVMSWSAGG